MASKKLSEMDFDEFVDGGLENESGISTDNSENPQTETRTRTKSKAKSKVRKHKADLSKLANEDPDFYAYLLQNDKELLDFDVSDEGSETEGASSDSDSTVEQVEIVSETGSELGDDESEVSVEGEHSTDLAELDDDHFEEKEPKNIITKKQIIFLAKALTTKNSISAYKQATNLFHTAVHQVGGGADEVSEKVQFEKVTTFNELVSCCLVNIPIFLKHQLALSSDVIVVRGKNCRKVWSKIREPTKQYLSDLVFTLDKLTESSLLCATLASTQPLVRLFTEFRKIRKQYVKILIKLWSKDERSVQLQSFLCMKGTILFAEFSLFTLLLKRSYLAYVQSTKFSSEQTKQYIAFLTDSLVELYSLDSSRAYQLAFVYIRQLAIHLRNAIISKTDETTRLVYNWQFIHCIEFWCKVLSTEGTDSTNLHQLIFPLVQVTLGAISLNPIVKFYPLRFRCIRALNKLSIQTDTYIPLSNFILETLDYTRSITKQGPMPPRPTNFHFNLKISKQYLKSKFFLDYTVEQAFELLLEHLSSYEHSIAFPEMCFPITLELKKFAKATKHSKHRREVKSLIEKVGKQSKFIEESRSSVEFAPKDIDKVREWEKTIASKQSNLKEYFTVWRKTVEKLFENQENGDESIDDDEETVTNGKQKKLEERNEAIEQPSSSTSELKRRMKKRVIKKLKETPVKKKIGPPSKNIQKTLTSFFKPSGNKDFEDPNKIKSGGVKRSSNDSEKFSKVILIDIDSTTCESDKMDHVKGDVSSNEIGSTDVCQQTEDKVVRAPSAGGCIIEDSTLSESDQLVRSEITATSTPMPGGVELCLEDDARCPRILFSPVLSIPKECDGVDDLSRLSELFEDLSTSFVDHLDLTLKATDDIELQQGVHKYIVLQVQQLQVYDNLQNLFIDAKKLELKSITNDFQANCLLMDDWFNTEIAINCRINLILLQSQKYPLNASTNTLEISIGATSENVYLIAYPDTLLSGSVVSGSFFCERKTILQDFIRIKETDLAKHALFGTICHEIFQQALVSNEFGMKALEQASLKISTAVSYLESFAFLGLTAADVLENANKHLSHFSDFGRKFINSQPTFLNGKIDLPWKGDCRDQTESAVAITEVLDIEESVWSPSYGLKGKIDASVSVKIHKRTKGLPNLLTQELVIPFELKTGKMTHSKGSNEHRAQLMLYTLLMGEKMHAGVPVGLLYYSITGHLQGVPANFQEIKGILQRRNELASYLHSFSSSKSPRLPPMLREPRICSKCSHLDACLLLHQNLEGGGEFSSGLGSTFSESVGKLTDDDKSYFTKWFEMIHLESKMEYRDNQVSEIWTKTSQEREALGQCLGRMVIKSSLKSEGGWKTTLVRHHTHLTKLDLEECSITAGDSLIVSYEDLSQLGIAWCSVVQLTNCEVVVESGANNLKKHDCNLDGDVNQFRLDKCDTYRPSSIVLMNLVSFFKSNERSYKLRQLIIHKSPPSFNIVRPLPSETLKIYSHLNTEQQSIIERVLASSDYLIVQGMPGTGKTTLTASLIRVLLSQNCTILLSSYTNTALDNILLKLVEFGVDFVRIGKKSSVHPTISKYLPQTCLKDVKTIEEVASFYNDKHLYAATCLSITNDFVQKKAFDWCIVDEASQLTQFLCLGPILLAKRFVLVGDLHQLPPLVRNVEARREGYNISLFRQLSEDHPRSVLTLSSQYRMNESVMSISNHIIYEKRMQAAERIVSEGKLSIPSWGLTVENPPDTWLLSCIHPDKPVVFIDTDSLESQEVEINQRVCNQIEANILQQIVSTLIMLGISSEQIGIITPYRQQVRLLNSTVGQSLGGSIEISTVDRFQGRDKDCILVSTVRNNAEGKVGELLPDRHRLNVMITRAKYKLIIVGSTRTLRHCEIFKELIEFFEGKQWIHTLQKEQFSVFNSTSQSVCT